MFATLHRLLEHTITRVLLSVAIIISLVPHEWMHANDAWFLAVFGPEFVLRLVLACREESADPGPLHIRRSGWRRPKGAELWLLAFDLIALISFLPQAVGGLIDGRWLRLFRLSRTFLLFRYWAPVVRDLWAVVSGRERRRQLALLAISLIGTIFAGTVVIDHVTDAVGDDFDGDGVVGDAHDHDFFVRMWWAFRQIEDPGNLLTSPHDTGTLVVSVVLTMMGLFLISFVIGVGSDVVSELTALGRMRPPGLARHTVLVNVTSATKRLLCELMGEDYKLLPGGRQVFSGRWLGQLWRNARRGRTFVVVGTEPERPEFLKAPELSGVVYRAWEDGDDDTFLARGDVATARRVVLLSDLREGHRDADGIRTAMTVVERLGELGSGLEGQRKLVTEILAGDNVSAALCATHRAPERLRTTVVPTERLLARFVACVGRRQGLAGVLTELLRSDGQEIYTYEYRYADRDQTLPVGPPALGKQATEIMDAIEAHGVADSQRRVTPIGLLVAHESGRPEVVLNPRPGTTLGGELAGFAALASHFELVSDVAVDLVERAQTRAPTPAPAELPPLQRVPPVLARNLVLCGFRPSTVNLLEDLLVAQPGAQVLVLVRTEVDRVRAMAELESQAQLIARGLLDGRVGRFTIDPESGEIQWRETEDAPGSTIWIATGDWTSTRQLAELPHGFGAAPETDLVMFVAAHDDDSDAQVTTGLMKLEDLGRRLGREGQRIVAEVHDPELALRLNRRYQAMDRPDVHVLSVEELRALLVFQAIVVPHFTEIFEELMSPRGQSLVPIRAESGGGRVEFARLAAQLRDQGRILVAVDERHGTSQRIGICAGPDGDEVDLDRAWLWVIDDDRA